MAREQGLKPQFLAIVVATQLGKDQGDVLKKAKEILPALNDFKISLGNELTDDNLLIVAALAQASNDKLAMRKTIEALSNEPGVDARKARTVWFLRERKKISDLQYEAVLKFLAIGAISQNPADFGVKAEPLVLQ
jgi:trehalose-6-phosphatase